MKRGQKQRKAGFRHKKLSPFTSFYLEAGADAGGPAHRVLENEVDQLKDAGRVEGRRAYSQLIQDAAYRPEVCCVVIWSLLHQLWRHIEWCAFDGRQHHGVSAHSSGKSVEVTGEQ